VTLFSKCNRQFRTLRCTETARRRVGPKQIHHFKTVDQPKAIQLAIATGHPFGKKNIDDANFQQSLNPQLVITVAANLIR
jgi:hypothetical protein